MDDALNGLRDEQPQDGGSQDEVIRFLSNPAIYGEDGPVERVETHAAHVFLCGETALKIKRAVKYDYLDFSSLEQRQAMLHRELELNHPTAPMIYEDVVPVTREADGCLALDGNGPPVEWVLRMWRFPAEMEFSAIAERGELTDVLADRLGHAIADYHANSEPREDDGAVLMAEIVEELRLAFSEMEEELGTERIAGFLEGCERQLAAVAETLTARSSAGHVRRCHGDLHLCNIVLVDGHPVPFDALEFNETFGICDVLYDLAFLVMDLRHEGLGRAANMVLNAYLYTERGMEDPGVAAMPLFIAVRAGIRAMVEIHTDHARSTPGRSVAEARAYLDEALEVLSPPAPRLIAIGGRSGSGKSTLSRSLAPLFGAAPGTVHIRSDLERKAIFCVDPLTHLPPDSYSKVVNRHVHQRLRIRAETILAAGYSVLLDAVYLTGSERVALVELAERIGVPFDGIWLEVDPDRLLARVAARQDDASDADETVVRQQLLNDAGEVEWPHVDATGPREQTFEQTCRILGLNGGAT